MAISRTYAGVKAEERRSARKERILEAAIKLYGERGYHNTTVQSVCDAAGLTKRYFYESFVDSADLLAACFRDVMREFLEELAAVGADSAADPRERADRLLLSFFEAIRDDPARARLFLLEAEGVSPGVTAAMREAQAAVANLLLPCEPEPGSDVVRDLHRSAATAGIGEIAALWTRSNYEFPISSVVTSAMLLLEGLLRPADQMDEIVDTH
jgi:AcrR family transcriptional regulator